MRLFFIFSLVLHLARATTMYEGDGFVLSLEEEDHFILLPKEASSSPLPCLAKSLHCEHPCDHPLDMNVKLNRKKRKFFKRMVLMIKILDKDTKCLKQNKIS